MRVAARPPRPLLVLLLVVGLGLLLTAASPVATPTAGRRWTPAPGTTWQWQLTVPVDLSVRASVYDIDGFDNPASVVERLHASGRKVICYIDAGAYEDYRPDAGRFPASVLGARDEPWEGERWLDIRKLDVLAPIMRARLDMCRAKGFDGVELDELDGWANDTGFPLTARDQLRYNRFLANEVRARGMAAGLKNDVEQIPQLVRDFDFAIDEQCFQYRECGALSPFISARKAVFHVEYDVAARDFCPVATKLGLSSMRKRLNLGVWRIYCDSPRARVRGASATGPDGVLVRIACPGFSPCTGAVRLDVDGLSRKSTIGRAGFFVGAGGHAGVEVRMTSLGRRLMSTPRGLRTAVIASTQNGPNRPTHSSRVFALRWQS